MHTESTVDLSADILVGHKTPGFNHYFLVNAQAHLDGVGCPCSDPKHPIYVIALNEKNKSYALNLDEFKNIETACRFLINEGNKRGKANKGIEVALCYRAK